MFFSFVNLHKIEKEERYQCDCKSKNKKRHDQAGNEENHEQYVDASKTVRSVVDDDLLTFFFQEIAVLFEKIIHGIMKIIQIIFITIPEFYQPNLFSQFLANCCFLMKPDFSVKIGWVSPCEVKW